MPDPSKPPIILVIDDDTEIRYSLSRVAFIAQIPGDGGGERRAGIAPRQKKRADLVFLDIRMGGMNGLETLQHIRSINPKQMVVS